MLLKSFINSVSLISRKNPLRFRYFSSEINVATYNVLSSRLSDPDYFIRCTVDDLKPSYRFERLKLKLNTEIEKNSIICLQEISMEWASLLHTYFSSKGYYLVTGLYGNKFDGRMGVGMAIPTSLYEILDCDITTLSESKAVAKLLSKSGSVRKAKDGNKPDLKTNDAKILEHQHDSFPDNLFKIVKTSLQSLWSGESLTDAQTNQNEFDAQAIIWTEALRKANQVLSLRLKPIGQKREFCVSTYHMPCSFRTPGIMLVHVALLIKHINEFVSRSNEFTKAPHVLAGDFNFKPDTYLYNILTNYQYVADKSGLECDSGSILLNKEVIREYFKVGMSSNAEVVNGNPYGPNIDNFDWSFNSTSDKSVKLYDSAYREIQGSEPDFTNYAFTKANINSFTSNASSNSCVTAGNNDSDAFIETLDYIFLSPHFKVNNVLKLPDRNCNYLLQKEQGISSLSRDSSDKRFISSLPSEKEPSDHLMLSASISML